MINLLKVFHLYTTWSYVLHILHHYGYIESTYNIAKFCEVVAFVILIINEFIYKRHSLFYYIFVFLLHRAPFLIFDFKKESKQNVELLCYTFFIYFIIFNVKVFEIYKDPIKYILT